MRYLLFLILFMLSSISYAGQNVTGKLYVSGNVGVGTTLPSESVAVSGRAAVSNGFLSGGLAETIRGNTAKIDFKSAGPGVIRFASINNENNGVLDIDLESALHTAKFTSLFGIDKFQYDGTILTTNFYAGGATPGVPFDVSTDLITWLKMEDTSGTTATDTQGSFNGTASRDISNWTTTGKINNGFILTAASSDFIDLGNSSTLKFAGDFTVAFWMKSTLTTTCRIMGNRSSTGLTVGWEAILSSSGGVVRFLVDAGSNSGTATGTTKVNTGDWFFIAMVRESENSRIYVNGFFNAEVNPIIGNTGTNAGRTYIGKSPNNANYFDGTLDNVQLYDRALTQDEIQSLYNFGDGTDDLSGGGTDLDTQVIGSSDSVTSDHLLSTSSDLVVEGDIETKSSLYIKESYMIRDTSGGTYTECFTQDGELACSVDSDGITDAQ